MHPTLRTVLSALFSSTLSSESFLKLLMQKEIPWFFLEEANADWLMKKLFKLISENCRSTLNLKVKLVCSKAVLNDLYTSLTAEFYRVKPDSKLR